MQTELIAVSQLTPDPANARKHNERNMQAIIDSLRAFGQQKPIVVDRRGVVIAGNGTLQAAKQLGWEEIAIVRTNLDPTQATAYGIADNRTSELAEWDAEALTSLMDACDDETRALLHFNDQEIERLLGTDSQRDAAAHDAGMARSVEEYNADTTRTFIVYLTAEQYESVVDRLDHVMEQLALANHAEALVHLCVEARDEDDPNEPASD